ncbi:MAG: hypothetical protein CMD16_03265 [Flavobacteriales bacterium]|nr:hypothetical protein [Flavobacteriales bacterium]|tara:strand:- start:82923 stop:83816 length:894 start_codon:yes stop_codon:yes gene_type:complete
MRYVFLFSCILIGCKDSLKTLPSSTGSDAEIICVVEDRLWEDSIDSLVYNIFGESIEGINQKESLFRIVQVSHSEFKSILKTHKNILIIRESGRHSIHTNKWAINQAVAHLKWEHNLEKMLKEIKEIRSIFVLKEIEHKRSLLERFSQKNIEKTIFTNFGIECIVPKEYEVIKNDSLIFWAHYDPENSDEIKNIIAFSFVPQSINIQTEVLQKTDSIFSKYLIGENKGSFVRIETEFLPYYFENTYRGLWKLENGFMGGPFLIKTYFIKNKIVVNIGLVFAPQSRKRKYIKEFEAIL